MTNLVANELRNKGFKIRVYGKAIEVSLSSRKVSQMEVEIALSQTFDDIRFAFQSTSLGVLVMV